MSTENAEEPVKRKSVADMWREREQAVLEKQRQPYKPTASPARRPLKNFEQKNNEGATKVTTNSSSNVGTNASSNHTVGTPSKTASNNAAGEASTSRRPVSAKSKFAMMGQKHAARPKKLPTYQTYQQPIKKNDPKSPESTNSDALLAEAFDDTVSAQEGKKLSTELSSRRRFPQPKSNQTRPSEYSSLQVSDSASIPKDVHPKVSIDNNDDESNISGLSSPGSPARSSRNQRRSNAIPENPEHDKSMDQDSFNSEGYSRGTRSTVSPQSGESPGVVADGFVEESDKEVSAFQDAMQKMSLEDIANDIKEEATAVFGGIGIDLNEGMAKITSFFAKKEENSSQAEKSIEVGETKAEGDAATTPTDTAEKLENAKPQSENVEPQTEIVEPQTELVEGERVGGEATEDVAETEEALPESVEVEVGAEASESVEPLEAVASEIPVRATEEPERETGEPVRATEKPETATDAPETQLEEAKKSNSDGTGAPDSPLEVVDSSEVFDPFASTEPGDFADFSAFPDDAFSNDFAAPLPAPTPTKDLPPERKPVSKPTTRKAAAQEEVAIEVEYLEDSDDDHADV